MWFAEQDIFRERYTVLLDSSNPYICGPVDLIKRLHAILGCTEDETEDCRFDCADDPRFPTLSISFPGFQTTMSQREYLMLPIVHPLFYEKFNGTRSLENSPTKETSVSEMIVSKGRRALT
ncbi:hypothetical protein T265_12259 [Opisthorchis viverrini]|uniref:Uncharacterized protein n=1 Tax=Opisthorchis viverrini TaxID=6198 RepID=A0A074ZT97_OPIVI|nr:hypothetical protein T265_12259 [Opisthorchis viverrini]KER18484.1 hypothetical protein T265_12259 [Opisthorchis viverrini]